MTRRLLWVCLFVASCSLGSRPPPSYMAASAPLPLPLPRPRARASTEAYQRLYDNPFLDARAEPLSTFGIDVDTASYANVRRFLREGSLPPPDAVRIEELINYFRYRAPEPADDEAVALGAEVGPCPWNEGHRLARLTLRARTMTAATRPPLALTFLVDVSGSMMDANKLPLVKRGLALLVERLDERDRVALVVYAGRSGVVLPPTSGAERATILRALESLEAGGSTNGGAGIALAYRLAREAFVEGGANRVVLATDGDFNVGVSSPGDLVRLIERERDSGVFLSVLGFGMGNYKDATLEQLADRGNGNYAYIDTLAEARKALVEDMTGTLITVARDVKVQVEVNPVHVSAYRLIGYEDRLLRAEDFADDRKDAGELGAGQTVTALYELAPAGGDARAPAIGLRYQEPRALAAAAGSGELLTFKVRWQPPRGGASRLVSVAVRDEGRALAATSPDFRFAAAVAAFGMVLRQAPDRGAASVGMARALAADAAAGDEHRRELVGLLDMARGLRDRVR